MDDVLNYHVEDEVDHHTVQILRNDVEFCKFVEVEWNKLVKENPGKSVDFIVFLFRRKFKNEISVKISQAQYKLDEFAGF